MNDRFSEMTIFFKISLVVDGGFMRGGLEPPLAEGASQIGQGASLFKPAVHTHLDVAVDVPKFIIEKQVVFF